MLPAELSGFLGGVLGALLVLFLLCVLRALTDSYASRCLARNPLPALHQSGRAGLPLMLWLSAVLVAFLAACSPPDSSIHSESDQWYQTTVKRDW